MKCVLSSICLMVVWVIGIKAQHVAGPMLGPVELREAKVWLAVQQPDNSAVLWVAKVGENSRGREILPVKNSNYEFTTCQFTIGGLEPATTYKYTITIRNQTRVFSEHSGQFTTKTLFQWRTPAPDFSFLTGSCSYFNQPEYDRPGKPYGLDSSIFERMATEKAAFMLWLGDNWYTREVDFHSNWGLWYRAWRDRSLPVLQKFWSSMGHIAIWDDHDYGPNDYGKSYHLKNTSRAVFTNFWLNHSYGDGKDGVYSRYHYNDVDFFLMDNRWWRDSETLPDSINGQPNPDKRMFGQQQMDWLKSELRLSKLNNTIAFRVIVVGSQVLNPVSPFDKMKSFPIEYYELMNFIREEKIEGVLFFSGDRHHSEIIKVQHDGLYPLYDITCSPLSSGTHAFSGSEANNPYRVLGIDKLQNYGKVSISGPRNNRIFKVNFLGLQGELINSWQVNEQELRMPR